MNRVQVPDQMLPSDVTDGICPYLTLDHRELAKGSSVIVTELM